MTKHAPTKGEERLLPSVTAVGKSPIAIPIAPNGFLGTRESPNGLHVAKSNAGHCNVSYRYSENTKLGIWVATQRSQYGLHIKGKKSCITLSRIQKLERLAFEWDSQGTAWEERLSELADYRKIYGHCNVPRRNNEKTKLANWVQTQRSQYKMQQEGKKSFMTLSRIQALESLDFEWVLKERDAHIPNPEIGTLGFRMGQPGHRLRRAFERTCERSQNPRAQQKLQAGLLGRKSKDQLQVAPTRKDIAFAHPRNPGVAKTGFLVSF
jgi:hypothetical protein